MDITQSLHNKTISSVITMPTTIWSRYEPITTVDQESGTQLLYSLFSSLAESRKLHNKVAPQFEKEFVHAIDDTNMYILSLLSPIFDFVNQKIDDPAIFLSDSKPYQASN